MLAFILFSTLATIDLEEAYLLSKYQDCTKSHPLTKKRQYIVSICHLALGNTTKALAIQSRLATQRNNKFISTLSAISILYEQYKIKNFNINQALKDINNTSNDEYIDFITKLK